MTPNNLSRSIQSAAPMEFGGTAAICAVAAMIGVLFAGSTAVTPLYVIYKQEFGFSQISLTLIYAVYAAGVLVALLALPLVLLTSPFWLVALRRHETQDPEICPRPAAALLHELQSLEDFDVSNQYTALGWAKPGLLRSTLMTSVLAAVQFICRHVSTRGYLGRVQSIHFARWVLIDDRRRLCFTSNYDGGHQAYMDDFINKVAFGLNVTFSNGVGWPHTEWLLAKGARREHLFKYFQRRHQLPTQVWYKAYPGLTLIDMERNARIRQGLEQGDPSDAEVLAWLKLL